MKLRLNPFSILLFLFVQACTLGSNNSNIGKADIQDSINSIKLFPYKYINTKRELRENDDSYNEMILYACGMHPNIDTLRMFCKAKKDSITDGYFHIIIFYDSPKNARFSKYAVTAMFGDEEKPLRHIKADYTYNVVNGYSKLTVYKVNMLVSKGQEYDVN